MHITPQVPASAVASVAAKPQGKPDFSIRNVALSLRSMMGSTTARIQVAARAGDTAALTKLYHFAQERIQQADKRRLAGEEQLSVAKSALQGVRIDRSPALSRGAEVAKNRAVEAHAKARTEVKHREKELAGLAARTAKFEDQANYINGRLNELGYDWQQHQV